MEKTKLTLLADSTTETLAFWQSEIQLAQLPHLAMTTWKAGWEQIAAAISPPNFADPLTLETWARASPIIDAGNAPQDEGRESTGAPFAFAAGARLSWIELAAPKLVERLGPLKTPATPTAIKTTDIETANIGTRRLRTLGRTPPQPP